jgi:hypothetical protein
MPQARHPLEPTPGQVDSGLEVVVGNCDQSLAEVPPGLVELTICPKPPVSPTHNPLDGHDIVSNAAGRPNGAPVSIGACPPNVSGPAMAACARPTRATHVSPHGEHDHRRPHQRQTVTVPNATTGPHETNRTSHQITPSVSATEH